MVLGVLQPLIVATNLCKINLIAAIAPDFSSGLKRKAGQDFPKDYCHCFSKNSVAKAELYFFLNPLAEANGNDLQNLKVIN